MPTLEAPSTQVIEAVAAHEGVDPTALSTPLYEAVDPDALDALFQARWSGPEPGSGRVEFDYCGYRVIVEPPGRVRLESTGTGRSADDTSQPSTSVD